MHLPRLSVLLATAIFGVAAACSRSTAPGDGSALRGPWGSDQASLTVSDTGATLEILASGSCFGSYGQVSQPILTPTFDLAGTYTQLTGAYPGKVQYAAQYAGAVAGDQVTLTVTVPALQQVFGPYDLTRGVSSSWTACLYP